MGTEVEKYSGYSLPSFQTSSIFVVAVLALWASVDIHYQQFGYVNNPNSK
jgi:hypothetical protein